MTFLQLYSWGIVLGIGGFIGHGMYRDYWRRAM